MHQKPQVLQLTGSPEDGFHEQLSLTYALDCREALADEASFTFLHTKPNGQHFILSDLDANSLESARPVTLSQAIEAMTLSRPDLALPQMFCCAGMTNYRTLLELIGIPYLGNTADVMALTLNKAKTRAIVQAAGVPTPKGFVLTGDSNDQSKIDALGIPLIVKPVAGDNSAGVNLVDSREDLAAAVSAAKKYDNQVLIEEFIAPGREVRCGVIEQHGELHCLPLQEYNVDKEHPIRLPSDKIIQSGNGPIELTSRLKQTSSCVDAEDDINATVHEMSKLAYRALGCRHYGLFDFRIDTHGKPWFLEAGLYCSFAQSSVICTMARYGGISLQELFNQFSAEWLTQTV